MWTVYCRTESHQGSCHCRGKTRQQWISNNVSPFCPLPNWRHPQCLSQIWTNKMRISCNQLLLLFSCVWGLTMGAFPSSVQIGKYGGSSQNTSFTLSALNCVNWMTKIRPSALGSTANVSAQIMRLEVGFVVWQQRVILGGNSFLDTFCLFVCF